MQVRDLVREGLFDLDDLIYDKFHLRLVQLYQSRVRLNVLTAAGELGMGSFQFLIVRALCEVETLLNNVLWDGFPDTLGGLGNYWLV